MADQSGSGLPPVALARLERARDAHVATSLLSTPSQAGLDSCGFVPVGEVMGCIVTHLGWQGYGGCGWMPGYSIPPDYTQTRRTSRQFSFSPYIDAVEGSWRTAVGRMLAECRALGGDGVVGVILQDRSLGEDNREYLAYGTAVRSIGTAHAAKPFSTTLQGQDVAKLLHSGFVPTSVLIAIAVGVRHDDWTTRSQATAYYQNIEVGGYTDLVHTVRAEARRELQIQLGAAGGGGAILTSSMRLEISEIEAGEGHRDHVALAMAIGTGIVEIGAHLRRKTPSPLAILPLRERGSTTRRRPGAQSEQIEQRGSSR